MESVSKKTLLNPSDRKQPVNISMPYRLMEVIDQKAFELYGLRSGGRSKLIVDILKEKLNVK